MPDRSGKKWTPEEDALILTLPLIPGATKDLAISLGRTRVAVSMRKAELSGTRNHQERSKYKPRKSKMALPPRPLPTARPAWFEDEDINSLLLLKNSNGATRS